MLHVKSPGVTIGYHNLPLETASSLESGWFDTGDILRCDDDGWNYFVGRADDMFVCAGENIYPGEVEAMLERHADIMQAIVVPAPNELKAHVPNAFVVVRPGAVIDEGAVKAHALANEAELVGVSRMNQDWVFEGYQANEPWIVVLGVAMDHDKLAKAPEIESPIEVMTQYNRGTRAARSLSNLIQSLGYHARPHGGPMAGPVLLIPPAIECGMAELGKNGSLINRTYGSSFRLAGVLTDLPLASDGPDEIAVDEFCINCRVCTSACPPDAIFQEKQSVRGVTKLSLIHI